MQIEPADALARLGRRIGGAIPALPEIRRLWLLVSVAVERSVLAKFMDMSEREIDDRVDEARRQLATELLDTDESARILEFRRSRGVFMSFVDAAARRRAMPAKRDSWIARLAGVAAAATVRPVPVAMGAVVIIAVALIPLAYIGLPSEPASSVPQGVGGAPDAEPQVEATGAGNPFVELVLDEVDALVDGERGAALGEAGRSAARGSSIGVSGRRTLSATDRVEKLDALMDKVRARTSGERLETNDDRDGIAGLWSFDGEAGQVVRVVMASVFDKAVHVLSPAGEELAPENDGGAGNEAVLEATLPVAGRYRIRVASDAGAGPYRMSVRSVSVRPLSIDGPTGVGDLIGGGAVERWSFDGAGGQVVRITGTSDAFDVVVRLLSPAGERVGRDGDAVRSDRELEAMLPVAGRYQILVSAASGVGAGSYRLAVRGVPVRTLSIDGPAVTGELGGAGGVERWGFDGAAGQVVRITGGADAFDTEVALLSPAGERVGDMVSASRNRALAEALLSPPGERAGGAAAGVPDGSALEVMLPVAGRYQIVVSASDGVGGGPYRAAVRSVPVGPVSVDGQDVVGELGGESTAGRWGFDGAAGQVVRVTASSEAFDTQVRFLSPAGVELARDDDGGPGTDSQLEATLPVDGGYLLYVTPFTGTGRYQVAVRTVAVAHLELDASPARGELRADGLAPRWGFDGAAGQVVRIAVGSEAFDTVVHLLSPSGEELARDFDGGPGTDSQLEATLPVAGRYQLRVTTDGGTGPYQVAVRTVPVAVTELALDAPPAGGELRDDGAVERWGFDGTAGQVVRITVGSEALDTVVLLLSPSGEEFQWDDDGGFGTDSQLEATLPETGRYQIVVSAYYGAGPYQVAVRTVPVTLLEIDGSTVTGIVVR